MFQNNQEIVESWLLNEETKLKKCPFCASQDLKESYTNVSCNKCKAKGPISTDSGRPENIDRLNAIALWNKRLK